jgi:hypothetical protein
MDARVQSPGATATSKGKSGKVSIVMTDAFSFLPQKVAKSAILLAFQHIIRGYPVNPGNPVSNGWKRYGGLLTGAGVGARRG